MPVCPNCKHDCPLNEFRCFGRHEDCYVQNIIIPNDREARINWQETERLTRLEAWRRVMMKPVSQ